MSLAFFSVNSFGVHKLVLIGADSPPSHPQKAAALYRQCRITVPTKLLCPLCSAFWCHDSQTEILECTSHDDMAVAFLTVPYPEIE